MAERTHPILESDERLPSSPLDTPRSRSDQYADSTYASLVHPSSEASHLTKKHGKTGRPPNSSRAHTAAAYTYNTQGDNSVPSHIYTLPHTLSHSLSHTPIQSQSQSQSQTQSQTQSQSQSQSQTQSQSQSQTPQPQQQQQSQSGSLAASSASSASYFRQPISPSPSQLYSQMPPHASPQSHQHYAAALPYASVPSDQLLTAHDYRRSSAPHTQHATHKQTDAFRQPPLPMHAGLVQPHGFTQSPLSVSGTTAKQLSKKAKALSVNTQSPVSYGHNPSATYLPQAQTGIASSPIQSTPKSDRMNDSLPSSTPRSIDSATPKNSKKRRMASSPLSASKYIDFQDPPERRVVEPVEVTRGRPPSNKAPAFVYTPGKNYPDIGKHLNSNIKFKIQSMHLTLSNEQLMKRNLWGTGVYTDDSDLVAVLAHTGSFIPSYDPPSFSGLQVILKVLPAQTKYPSSISNGIKSRKWGTYEGVSIRIEKLQVIEEKKTGPSPTYQVIPINNVVARSTLLKSSEKLVRKMLSAQEDLKEVPTISLRFNLGNEPCVAYNLSLLGDRGLDPKSMTSAKFATHVLYVESTSYRRYELAFVRPAHATLAITADLEADQLMSDASQKGPANSEVVAEEPSVEAITKADEPSPTSPPTPSPSTPIAPATLDPNGDAKADESMQLVPVSADTAAAAIDEPNELSRALISYQPKSPKANTPRAAKYRWSQVVSLAAIGTQDLKKLPLPLEPPLITVIADDLEWDDIEWGVQSVTVKGVEYRLTNYLWHSLEDHVHRVF